MSQSCCCKPSANRRVTKATSLLLSSLTLLLMPKCPVCLAAYVTLITGLGVSTAAATRLHTGLILACGAVLGLALVGALWNLWRRSSQLRRN